MDVSIAELKKDVRNLYEITKRQDEERKVLSSLAESVAKTVTEMEYMRKDMASMKNENTYIREELKEHIELDINKRLGRVDFIEEKIVGWTIIFILGGLSMYFLGK